MPRRTDWIRRAFESDTPLSMFPNVLERLRGTPARIEDRVRGLDAAVLTARVADGWSIQENVGHLIDIETIWSGRLDDFDIGLAELRPADMSNARTYAADYNSLSAGEVVAGFRAVRAELVGRLEALTDEAVERMARHPRLDQPMRVLDLMVFAAEHDDHHLVTITDLLAAQNR